MTFDLEDLDEEAASETANVLSSGGTGFFVWLHICYACKSTGL